MEKWENDLTLFTLLFQYYRAFVNIKGIHLWYSYFDNEYLWNLPRQVNFQTLETAHFWDRTFWQRLPWAQLGKKIIIIIIPTRRSSKYEILQQEYSFYSYINTPAVQRFSKFLVMCSICQFFWKNKMMWRKITTYILSLQQKEPASKYFPSFCRSSLFSLLSCFRLLVRSPLRLFPGLLIIKTFQKSVSNCSKVVSTALHLLCCCFLLLGHLLGIGSWLSSPSLMGSLCLLASSGDRSSSS